MKIAVIAVLTNVVLSLSLVGTLKHTGLALAISLAAWVNASLLFGVLWRRGIYCPQRGWLTFLLRVALAVSVMVLAINYLNSPPEVWFAWDLVTRLLHLLMLVVVGAVSYFVSLFLTGIRPRQMLLAPTLKK